MGKIKNGPRLFLLFLLATILIAADFILTLINQPAEYWQDFSKVSEANPLVQPFLVAHPVLFGIGYPVYLCLVLGLYKVSKPIFIIILSAGLILTHGFMIFLHFSPDRFLKAIEMNPFIAYPTNFTPVILLLIGFILWLFSKSKQTPCPPCPP